MKLSPEELSDLATKNNNKRVEDGTHPFQRRADGTSFILDKVENGTHQWLGPDHNNKRIEDGTHNWMKRKDGTSFTSDRVEDGTHPFLGGEVQRKTNRRRLEDGTHHFLDGEISRKNNKKMLENGTHPFLNTERTRANAFKQLAEGRHASQIEYICPYCYKAGKGGGMKQWHFDNCKLNPANIIEEDRKDI